ncbi:hypothetical protein TYRP_012835 [Tyrophagus putrescentiae]|nr:hypothetical protein TYRP_012835 [Tyrophagus putrescentiae]
MVKIITILADDDTMASHSCAHRMAPTPALWAEDHPHHHPHHHHQNTSVYAGRGPGTTRMDYEDGWRRRPTATKTDDSQDGRRRRWTTRMDDNED